VTGRRLQPHLKVEPFGEETLYLLQSQKYRSVRLRRRRRGGNLGIQIGNILTSNGFTSTEQQHHDGNGCDWRAQPRRSHTPETSLRADRFQPYPPSAVTLLPADEDGMSHFVLGSPGSRWVGSASAGVVAAFPASRPTTSGSAPGQAIGPRRTTCCQRPSGDEAGPHSFGSSHPRTPHHDASGPKGFEPGSTRNSGQRAW
jgi:hypothetical protein